MPFGGWAIPVECRIFSNRSRSSVSIESGDVPQMVRISGFLGGGHLVHHPLAVQILLQLGTASFSGV